MADLTDQAIYQTSIMLLARREHSRQELHLKLQTRFPQQEAAIQKVLTRLQQESYLSDTRFADAYVRARRGKGFGEQRLRQELRLRGVEDDIIAAAVTPSENADPLDVIRQVWRKKFTEAPRNLAEKSRQIRFMQYRGFNQAQIHGLLRELEEHG